MMNHPNTVLGLSDGGARLGTICDGSFPTSNLIHWTRDARTRAEDELETMIAKQTRATAEAVGLLDRSLLKPNKHQRHRLRQSAPARRPSSTTCLPGGRRLIQYADGYTTTIVSGRPVYRDGQPTGALPGGWCAARATQPDGGKGEPMTQDLLVARDALRTTRIAAAAARALEDGEARRWTPSRSPPTTSPTASSARR